MPSFLSRERSGVLSRSISLSLAAALLLSAGCATSQGIRVPASAEGDSDDGVDSLPTVSQAVAINPEDLRGATKKVVVDLASWNQQTPSAAESNPAIKSDFWNGYARQDRTTKIKFLDDKIAGIGKVYAEQIVDSNCIGNPRLPQTWNEFQARISSCAQQLDQPALATLVLDNYGDQNRNVLVAQRRTVSEKPRLAVNRAEVDLVVRPGGKARLFSFEQDGLKLSVIPPRDYYSYPQIRLGVLDGWGVNNYNYSVVAKWIEGNVLRAVVTLDGSARNQVRFPYSNQPGVAFSCDATNRRAKLIVTSNELLEALGSTGTLGVSYSLENDASAWGWAAYSRADFRSQQGVSGRIAERPFVGLSPSVGDNTQAIIRISGSPYFYDGTVTAHNRGTYSQYTTCY